MSNDFSLNRPIHLARRDVYTERAMELLSTPVDALDTGSRIAHVEHALALWKTAQYHGAFASKGAEPLPRELDFVRFLGLVVHNVQSALAMMQHQAHLESEQSFLCRFLDASAEECALPALHYERRADDILQGIWHLLRLVHRPYHTLREAGIAALPEAGRARYHKACASFREEVMARYPTFLTGPDRPV